MNKLDHDIIKEKIRPEPQDFEEVERQYGRPESDTQTERAEFYRLAQAQALIRQYTKR